MVAAVFSSFLARLLEVLLFRSPLPTFPRITTRILEQYRTIVLPGNGTMSDLPAELAFERVIYPQDGQVLPYVRSLGAITNKLLAFANLDYVAFLPPGLLELPHTRNPHRRAVAVCALRHQLHLPLYYFGRARSYWIIQ
jgi:hypothetical protein